MTESETAPLDEPDTEPVDEPAEPDPDTEPEPDSEPDEELQEEPAEPEARAPSAAELKRFEAENTRHERRLAEIMGDDFAAFEPCPACGGVGFTPRPPEEALNLVKATGVIECPTCSGAGGNPCPACAGKGGLEFPTKVEGQRFQSCPSCGGTGMNVCVDCAGNGWKRESAAAATPVAAVASPAANGGSHAPPGYILVKVDPNAPDLPAAVPDQALSSAPVLP